MPRESEQNESEKWWTPDGDPDCPKCSGLGWVSRGPSFRVLHDNPGPIICECLERKHKARLWEKALPWMELPQRGEYEKMTFERYIDRSPEHIKASFTAFQLAQGRTDKPFLVIVGGSGNGKTHLSIAAVKTAQGCRTHAKYAQAGDLKGDIQSRIGKEDPDAEGMLQRYCDVSLLALDDFGVERMTDWTLELFDRLIDSRYRSELATIVTTNVDLPSLPMRIADRLMDKRKSNIFVLTAPSFRSQEQW